MSHSEPDTDVVELCGLLQCLGFSVKSLDASIGNVSQDAGGSRTVVINCQMSGLHVVLESSNMSCSCPAQSEQNSGVWQVSGVTGGKQLEKEFGCNILGSLPRSHRERLAVKLHEMIRCIKENNESIDVEKVPKEENKSASMTDLHTPEKLLCGIKAETPTRYRSLDTLTGGKETAAGAGRQIPAPGPLQRVRLSSGCDDDTDKRKMCTRQSTYTLPSTPGSFRSQNKTSSPINAPANNFLEDLMTVKRMAADITDKLADIIRECENPKDDSSISSLAINLSNISVLKPVEASTAQFASSPNLSGLSARDDKTKSQLKRYESVSTSNLLKTANPKEGKMSRLKRLSPNFFKKETVTIKVDKMKSQDSKSYLNNLLKLKTPTPVRIPTPGTSPNISTGSMKKYKYVKSTIPRPAKKD